jgi:hypothetical protein
MPSPFSYNFIAKKKFLSRTNSHKIDLPMEGITALCKRYHVREFELFELPVESKQKVSDIYSKISQ